LWSLFAGQAIAQVAGNASNNRAIRMSRERLNRVMHVDDDGDIRDITKLILESIGDYTVCSCESGAVALEKLSTFAPEMILLDVEMPGMNGPAFLKFLCETPNGLDIPVVFMTGAIAERDRAVLRASTAIEIIEKPFEPLALPGRLAKIWERHVHAN
jgi:two-component system, OmpR family, response regulator